jgi:hypothetical protein
MGYCDQRCLRPDDHEGLCWGNDLGCDVGQVWRDATPEEEAGFRAESEEWQQRGVS